MLRLRVILPVSAERLDLPERPSSVEELRDILTDKFKLAPGFSLTFNDPTFDNEPCNLTDIQYLPEGKAVLRVDWDVVLTPVPVDLSLAADSDISVERETLAVERETRASPPSASSSRRAHSRQDPDFSVGSETLASPSSASSSGRSHSRQDPDFSVGSETLASPSASSSGRSHSRQDPDFSVGRETLASPSSASSSGRSHSSQDPDFSAGSDMSSSPTSAVPSQGRRSSRFPAIFTVPTFSYTLELKLRSGGAVYSETNTLMSITREMKSEILAKLAEVIYAYESYPTLDELEKVAKALVEKHRCIGNAGPDKAWNVWTTSLKDKMNNYRAALNRAGCTEVRVNKRGRGTQGVVKLKRPRRAELNFLPDHPVGVGDIALESDRVWLENELKKRNMNEAEVKAKMDHTFSLRRKEVVAEAAHVSTIRQRWPALFLLDQVYAEFKRVAGKELMDTFFTSLDEHTRGLIRVYRDVAHHPTKESLRSLLDYLDDQTTEIIKHRRVVAVKGLQYYLGEKTELFKTCQPEDVVEASSPMEMGILEIVAPPGGPEAAPRAAVVLDGEILCDSLPDAPTALAVLFGFIYTLNIAYPPAWLNFFEVIQKLIMSMDADKSGKTEKLNKLRTKLSQLQN